MSSPVDKLFFICAVLTLADGLGVFRVLRHIMTAHNLELILTSSFMFSYANYMIIMSFEFLERASYGLLPIQLKYSLAFHPSNNTFYCPSRRLLLPYLSHVQRLRRNNYERFVVSFVVGPTSVFAFVGYHRRCFMLSANNNNNNTWLSCELQKKYSV